jgi:LPS O-antigen subunit length determinant protein (WzzB/FepE family)
MTDHPTPAPADDEIDLLDLLVTVAESWKLLVFVPLLVGISVFSLFSLIAQNTFQSNSVLKIYKDTDYVAGLYSNTVLDPLLDEFGFIAKAKGNVESARGALAGSISHTINRNATAITISVKADSPEMAQNLNARIVKNLIELNNPRGNEKEILLKAVEQHKLGFELGQKAIEGLIRSFSEKGLDLEQAQARLAQAYSLLQAERNLGLESEKKLLGIGAEAFIQAPNLPVSPLGKGRAIPSLVAVLVTGFLLLVFVFIRKIIRTASTNPESAVKLAQIRQAFGLSAGPK